MEKEEFGMFGTGRVEKLCSKDSGGVAARDPVSYREAQLLCGKQAKLQSCDFVAESRCHTGGRQQEGAWRNSVDHFSPPRSRFQPRASQGGSNEAQPEPVLRSLSDTCPRYARDLGFLCSFRHVANARRNVCNVLICSWAQPFGDSMEQPMPRH